MHLTFSSPIHQTYPNSWVLSWPPEQIYGHYPKLLTEEGDSRKQSQNLRMWKIYWPSPCVLSHLSLLNLIILMMLLFTCKLAQIQKGCPWNNNFLPPAGFQCSSSQQFPDSAQPSPHPGCLQSWWPDHSGGQAVFKSYAEKRNYGESDKHFYLATSNPTNSSSSMYVIWWVQWEVVVEDMIHLGV